MALLTCDDTGRSLAEVERGTYVRLADGSFARRIVIVTGSVEPIDCDTAGFGTLALRKGSIVRIATDQYALQVVDET